MFILHNKDNITYGRIKRYCECVLRNFPDVSGTLTLRRLRWHSKLTNAILQATGDVQVQSTSQRPQHIYKDLWHTTSVSSPWRRAATRIPLSCLLPLIENGVTQPYENDFYWVRLPRNHGQLGSWSNSVIYRFAIEN